MSVARVQRACTPLSVIEVRTNNYHEMSDGELVIACQRKDPNAFKELIQRHQRTVYAMLYRLAPDWTDTADLAQEVFIRIWRSIATLRNPLSFKTWLHQIVTNLFYDELRKRPRHIRSISMDEPINGDDGVGDGTTRDIPDSAPLPDECTYNQELARAIHSAMAKLPEQFRTTIVLRELRGMSYEEIACVTHSEIGTVKSRIARARAKIQEILAPYINDAG